MAEVDVRQANETLLALEQECRELGLLSPAVFLSRSHPIPENSTYIDLKNILNGLSQRISEAFSVNTCFMVEPSKIHFFEAKDLFGEGVSKHYPSTSRDIAEAGRCFALNRHAACVFHLMRVAETPLILIAKRLGISFKNHPWGWIISDILDKMKSLDNNTPKKLLLREPILFLNEVKELWRDPGIHTSDDFSPERTEGVYNSIRSFMQRLVEKGIYETDTGEASS